MTALSVSPPGAARSGSPGYARYVLLMTFLAYMLSYTDRMIVAAILPVLQEAFRFSDGQAGLLVGLAFALLYAIAGLPLGLYADRGNRRNIIAIAVAVWSVATAICGAAQNFTQLLLARVLVGAGEAGCVPASQSLLSDYFPPERRSSALAIFMAGASIGTIAGLGLGGYLAAQYGWRIALFAVGLPGLALAVLIRLTVREPIRGVLDPVSAPLPETPGGAFSELMGIPVYMWLALVFTMLAFCNMGVVQWAPSFLFRYHGISLARVGLLYGMVFGLGSLLGMLAGGFVGDRMMRRDPRIILRFLAGAYAFAVIPGMLFVYAPTLPVSLAANFLLSLIMGCGTGPILGLIQTVVPARLRATATASNMLLLAIFGVGAGPVVIGYASELLAPLTGAESLRMAMLIPVLGPLLPAIGLLFAARTIGTDAARRQASLRR